MNNKNRTKREALGKLDELVCAAITFYKDTSMPSALTNITPKDTKYFTPEQYREIRRNLDRINESLAGLVTYCRDRDIGIPKDIFDVDKLDNSELSDEVIAES